MHELEILVFLALWQPEVLRTTIRISPLVHGLWEYLQLILRLQDLVALLVRYEATHVDVGPVRLLPPCWSLLGLLPADPVLRAKLQ